MAAHNRVIGHSHSYQTYCEPEALLEVGIPLPTLPNYVFYLNKPQVDPLEGAAEVQLVPYVVPLSLQSHRAVQYL